MAGNAGSLQGYNLFAYCFNNPVNLTDSEGNWPKWVKGVVNIVSGVFQTAAGVTLAVASGWTGIGAVGGGVLILNGSADVAQGIGQITNAIFGKEVLSEENAMRVGAEELGEIIGGETGAVVAGYVYDGIVFVSSLYAFSSNVNLPKKPPNPGKPFRKGALGIQEGIDPNTLIPTKDLSRLSSFRINNAVKYAGDQAIRVTKSGVILDGHHRVAYAIKYGKMVDVFVEIFK